MKGLSDAGDAGNVRDAGTPGCNAGDAGEVCEDAEEEWMSACSVSGGLGKQPCSLLHVWVRSGRVLGWARGVWVRGRGWVGVWAWGCVGATARSRSGGQVLKQGPA